MTGHGQMTFGGVDITNPPYYSALAAATKYLFMDAYVSTQFTTDPQSLVTTRPYVKDWIIEDVIRILSPDNTRESLLAAQIALANLFDPNLGEQQLIHAEYPYSYFMAKRQSSTISQEADSPYKMDIDVKWAATGPAYSTTEMDLITSVTQRAMFIDLTSGGDSLAYPRWRIYSGATGVTGYSIENQTTGEQISWTGTLNFGDYIDFVMDAEYGTPRTILINDVEQTESTFVGPAWPHLAPGENIILLTQTKGYGPALFEVTWRDRLKIGMQNAQTPIVQPPYRLPTGLTINGCDTGVDLAVGPCGGGDTPIPGSYILSGTLLDIYLNPIPDVAVTIYKAVLVSGWAPGTWTVLGTATTDANGKWVLPPTTASEDWFGFRAYYSGDDEHIASYSGVFRAIPPDRRGSTTLSLNVTNNDPEYTISGTYAYVGQTAGGIAGAKVLLYITENSIAYGGRGHDNNDKGRYWRLMPGVEPVLTDGNGDYSFTFTTGTANPWGDTPSYYHVYTDGTLSAQGGFGDYAGTLIDETKEYASESSQPIEYQVMLPPTAITNGTIQYYAANGYTTCYCIAYPGTSDTYATELAIIKALGMKPILDIEGITGNTWGAYWSGSTWVPANFSVYDAYFGQLRDAGWTIGANEAGVPGCVEYARQYFTDGYVNFHISEGEMTFGYSTTVGGTQYLSPPVEGIYIDPGTTANVWESYYDSMVWRAIMPGTDACAAFGIPCGILAGAWAWDWNEIWINSVSGLTPVPGEDTSTGNTYQSILDWSYGAGVPLTYFAIDCSWPSAIFNYVDMGFPELVAQLQETYPPKGTEALIPPTVLASNLTLNYLQNEDTTFNLSGQLTKLVSGLPITGASIHLDVSTDNSTWSTASVSGNPATTDASGNFSWNNISLSLGTHYYRVYYAGDTSHMAFYGPYGDGTGLAVVNELPAMSQVGSFTNPTSSGTQTISGLDFQPTAVMFWVSDATSWAEGNSQAAYGFAGTSDSNITSGYLSIASEDANATSATSSRLGSAAIGLYDHTGAALNEAALASFNTDGFTLNWTITATTAYTVHYLALGGSDLTNAAVVTHWQKLTTGAQVVTGVGFQPDCVLHIGAMDDFAAPHTSAYEYPVFGAMDSLGNQWAQFLYDVPSVNPTQTGRLQLTDSCIAVCNPSGTVTTKASFTSMDVDGFTLNYGTTSGFGNFFLGLCLKGGSFEVGSFNKSTSTGGTQTVSVTTGLTPAAVLARSVSYIASASKQNGLRLMTGASDGTNNGVIALTDENGVSPTVCYNYQDSTNALVVSDNDTGTTEAEGAIGNFVSGSFDAVWSTNNAVATQILYLVFGHT